MRGSKRRLSILGLVVLVLVAGAIQADPEAHPVLVNFPPAIETHALERQD
jgi:hypothetical protein